MESNALFISFRCSPYGYMTHKTSSLVYRWWEFLRVPGAMLPKGLWVVPGGVMGKGLPWRRGIDVNKSWVGIVSVDSGVGWTDHPSRKNINMRMVSWEGGGMLLPCYHSYIFLKDYTVQGLNLKGREVYIRLYFKMRKDFKRQQSRWWHVLTEAYSNLHV